MSRRLLLQQPFDVPRDLLLPLLRVREISSNGLEKSDDVLVRRHVPRAAMSHLLSCVGSTKPNGDGRERPIPAADAARSPTLRRVGASVERWSTTRSATCLRTPGDPLARL